MGCRVAGLGNTGGHPDATNAAREVCLHTAKCPVTGQNCPPTPHNTDLSMQKHLEKYASKYVSQLVGPISEIIKISMILALKHI